MLRTFGIICGSLIIIALLHAMEAAPPQYPPSPAPAPAPPRAADRLARECATASDVDVTGHAAVTPTQARDWINCIDLVRGALAKPR